MSVTSDSRPVRLEGVHCVIEISRPCERVVLIRLSGTDTGELGELPFFSLAPDLADPRPLSLFIDARGTSGASLDVSNAWARWLRTNRDHFAQVTMLPGSRFIRVTADFVRRFADMGDRMCVTTDPAAFDAELADAVRRGAPPC